MSKNTNNKSNGNTKQVSTKPVNIPKKILIGMVKTI